MALDLVPFTNGGLDPGGRSYSGVLLGGTQNIGGTVFGLVELSEAVSSRTVKLTAGQFTTLKLLATGVNGTSLHRRLPSRTPMARSHHWCKA